ncbi:hypothetical protein ACPWT1_11540 [Ramlibacter sp. MMS24-I3-19]|uniref:hypothetical protein n=1 Tax=Ramlibacter sp. MMS24-I3-19 TaxID=3416606 RepID=UPI003D05C07F
MAWGSRRLGLALALATTLWAGAAGAQQLYKCGGSYQDRPCADQELQKRYAAGRFDVDQVNPDTDKDCARLVGDVMPYWMRMHKGESLEALRAEYDARPVPREDKSAMRDLLLALKSVEGTPTQARSQLETQCMTYKKRKGVPTERELETARAGGSSDGSVGAPSARELAARRRAEIAADRAARAAHRSWP